MTFDEKLPFKEFRAWCVDEARTAHRHHSGYVEGCLNSIWERFRLCARRLPQGGKVLSLGAGGAYVERLLVLARQAVVTVADFAQAVEEHRPEYDRYGFQTVACDLSQSWQISADAAFDMALSFEIMEHLPIPPHKHLESMVRYLKPGGLMVVSTPNLARLSTISHLLRGKPVFCSPDQMFAPVGFDNEGVHRREYVATEIMEAMRQAGLQYPEVHYIVNGVPPKRDFRARLHDAIVWAFPRFRPTMILVGQKL
jgi:2-polyprenyl-3-methyl-5-hydroxy-6-metoxy-1,4-benzoquinol methylase